MTEPYSVTSATPLAFYDPDTCSLRMSQGTLLWEGSESLASLPAYGMTVDGALFQRQKPERLTSVNAYLYGANLPTPVMNDGTRGADNSRLRNNGKRKSGQSGTLNLAGAIALLPTATARDYKNYGENVNWQRIADRSGLHGAIMNQQLDDGKQ